MGAIYIAKYILRGEYQCHCCNALPPGYDEPYGEEFDVLFDSFERIRDRWGTPIRISSGYRCPIHNSFVGGKPLSAHMFGLALDLDVESYQVEDLHNVIDAVTPDLRVGQSDGFIHIDVAWMITPKASHAWERGYRWSY